MADTKEFLGTGRRKTAVARVRLAVGSGKIVINGRPFENYFGTDTLRTAGHAGLWPRRNRRLNSTSASMSPAAARPDRPAAIRHGIARALLMVDAALRPALKSAGYLTRDPRMRERKKYGQPGARKRFQYSKR